jgi:hypothetical protein
MNDDAAVFYEPAVASSDVGWDPPGQSPGQLLRLAAEGRLRCAITHSRGRELERWGWIMRPDRTARGGTPTGSSRVCVL